MGAGPLPGGDEGNGRAAPASLAEINVTPLVDVMLVLLVIFMITSSAQSLEMERSSQRLREEQAAVDLAQRDQLVEIDLPKVSSKQVDIAESKKLVLSFTASYTFHVGPTQLLSCAETVENWPAALEDGETGDERFRSCVTPLVAKLLKNEKIKTDQELYLRADRGLPYGRVLYLMAEIRRAGVHKFGLVADEGLP
jgi:biopolymer transport protein TolR